MDAPFRGTARYRIRRRIGTGGMGVVYQAYDKVRCVDVAIKTLKHADPNAIYRLKREFRALTDVSHPNLITLHELVSDGEMWFVAMELIRGQDFISYVREKGAFQPKSLSSGEFLSASWAYPPPDALKKRSDSNADTEIWDPPSSVVNIRRLRRALRQLVEGLVALHESGVIHRDLKPSNILVDEGGRVVVLDFGLVAETQPLGLGSTTEGITGTPAYMAPEQASLGDVGTAADWYSLGVVLYEALTGVLPFPGRGVEALMQKMHDTPLIPSTIAPGTPVDLNVLCMELLSREPEDRPDGSSILQRLAPDRRQTSTARAALPRDHSSHGFIGRRQELAALEAAFDTAAQGKPQAVFVRGRSGMGKTALTQHFIDGVRDREDVVVFAGRCYERETVPYKAIDTIIDRLAHYLANLEQLEIEALLPRDIRALTRVFPVLDRVEAIALAPASRAKIPDPKELRRRAFNALRELLSRIGERWPVIVCIDDIQWGDADSAKLLQDLMRPPEAPPVLWIGCYRAEDERKSVLVQELLGNKRKETTRSIPIARPTLISLDPLTTDEAMLLASSVLTGDDKSVRRRAATVVAEARGNPFLVESLAVYAESQPDESPSGSARLHKLLRHTINLLSRDSRKLLEIVAVAGRPLPTQVALHAAGIDVQAETSTVTAIRAANLVRTFGTGLQRSVETYHDRIREAVVADLPAEIRKARHRSLAIALEAFAPHNLEPLYVHYVDAGEPELGARYAERAADEAMRTLAWEHAATMYAAALEVRESSAETSDPESSDAARALRIKLGEALSQGARGNEAGRIFMRAAEGAPEDDAIDLKRRAAEEWLINGRLLRGTDVVTRLLKEFGHTLATHPADAIESLGKVREQLRVRGRRFKERTEDEIPRRQLIEIDILRAISVGFLGLDSVRGADFQARHLLAALEAGEPVRIARALALEATYAALAGSIRRERVSALIREAVELAKRLRDPKAIGTCALAIGVSAHLMGQWPRALRQLRETEKLLRERCTGVVWELSTARVFSLMVRYYLGDLRELVRLTPKVIEDADRRGDLYTSGACRLGHGIIFWLIHDDVPEARRQLQVMTEGWKGLEFTIQHHFAEIARLEIDVYAGLGDKALGRLRAILTNFEQSQLEKVQYLRIDALYLKVRIYLIAARSSLNYQPLFDEVEKTIAELESESTGWAIALGKLSRGLLALALGEDETAVNMLERAISDCEGVGMALHAAGARYRLGIVLGGQRGEHLSSGAVRWLANQGVKAPIALLDSIAPPPLQATLH